MAADKHNCQSIVSGHLDLLLMTYHAVGMSTVESSALSTRSIY